MPGRGREAQRRRTRRALVDAAQKLIAAGRVEPSIEEIAAAAEVSRRTVYTHFASLDQLLLDATLGALSEAYVDTALASADADADAHGHDVHARVEALVRALHAVGDATLPLGRQLLRLTVERFPPPGAPVRGARRIAWIEAAVEPLRSGLSAGALQRLVSGLSMVIGFEAAIVLRDVRGLDADAELATTLWAAHALIDAASADVTD